ncbi:MAG: cupin domain-containing protein [Candidatus Thiodiazotropha sp.]
MQIEHWDETVDGEISEAAMRAKLEALGYRVTRYVYPPGTYFPPHEHAVDKIDGVLSGRFRMSMGSRSVILEAGDTLHLPRGAVHSAEVVGDQPVISLDAIKEAFGGS